MGNTVQEFIARWEASGSAERANKDSFLHELCDLLGVDRPVPATGDRARDRYCYESDVTLVHEGGRRSIGRMDLFKEGCFILEAKQGSNAGALRTGTARRGTPGWNVAMSDAYGQALGYARTLDTPPPFILVVDIGHCFDLYAAFDGTTSYRPFPNAQHHRIFLRDLAGALDTLRAIWSTPHSLDPSRRSAKVTRDVAETIALLARDLEAAGHPSEAVARFLMRCIFTMFAEDIGLIPERIFTDAIEKHWLPHPERFPDGVLRLWRTMDTGGGFGFDTTLLKINGGLFRDPEALPLRTTHLEALLDASKHGWSEVEPTIFGTLIERALDPRERHRLGAHYTPRAYVERLVRPTVEEPLRAEWDAVRVEVRQLVGEDFVATPGKGRKKLEDARKLVRKFHRDLCKVRVLDPACGSGNFLYVTLDILKRLESEVLGLLEQLGEKNLLLEVDSVTVTPAQFYGIEKKRWAKEIAELVLWIGYLQWHARTRRNADGSVAWRVPVLEDLHNIEGRDAVLAWSREEPVLDDSGRPVTRWDGVTRRRDPLTGRDLPDPEARVQVSRILDATRASWPEADFIVGNPPFLGHGHMRAELGDGYTEALRKAHPEVPESCDLVMYWWNHAADLLRAKGSVLRRFGFITTNSISQTFNRRVLERALGDGTCGLTFAVPDHPWVDDVHSADVRIAMTALARGITEGVLGTVVHEQPAGAADEAPVVTLSERRGTIHGNLRIGANLANAGSQRSNVSLSSRGVSLHGAGFIVTEEQARALGLGTVPGLEKHIRLYRNGRDLAATPRGVRVIDLFGLTEAEVRARFPSVYQHVAEHVKPERLQKASAGKDAAQYADAWWQFGKPRPALRMALRRLPRYIVTIETARHRWFTFLDAQILADNKLVNIALDDAYFLGVLSSRAHVVWSLAVGARLGVGNDPVYVKSRCFDAFAFPDPTDARRSQIRDLAEKLDAHRKERLRAHPTLTVTGMYNVLAMLRAGDALDEKSKVIHQQALTTVLRQLHDELDAAVFDAYGWPTTLTDEEILEKLVALNAERAAEERTGLVRWLRPEFQNPTGTGTATQGDLPVEADDAGEETAPAAASTAAPWPKKPAEQFGVVRSLLTTNRTAAFSAEQVRRSFKGAAAEDVVDALDGLVHLGLAVRFADADPPRWVASA